MNIKRFKQSQRFRVIIDSVSFYTNAERIRYGIGDFSKCNAAAQKALDALEFTRSGDGAADKCAVGIGGTWEGHQIQLSML